MANIKIPKGSIDLAGLLYRPAKLLAKAPGMVVVHPGGGVKEQTASIYAKRLAEQGYVAICYDASHQGASGGEPHFLEDPNLRVSDIPAVVDHLQSLPEVDPERIVITGICAGGGYAVAAAKGDHRLKAVAIISAVNIGDGARHGWYGTDTPTQHLPDDLDRVAAALTTESSSPKYTDPLYAPYVPPVLDKDTPRDLADAHDYYCTPRARHPNAQNKMLLRSAPLIMTFDAWNLADLLLTQPLLIIVGEKAESRWHSEKLYRQLEGKNQKMKKVVVPNGRHMDFYDKDQYVNPAVEAVTSFFQPVVFS